MARVSSIRLSDLLQLAWSAIRRNRLRSVLTIGAIAVGISAMMYLISLGFGLESLTLGGLSQSSALLTLDVQTGSEVLQPLNQVAVARIRAIPNSNEVLPQLTIKGTLSLEKQQAESTIVGVDSDFLQISDTTQLISGRYYRDTDQQTMVVTSGFLKLFGLQSERTPLVLFNAKLSPDDFPKLPTLTNINISGVVNSNAIIAYLPRQWLEGVIGTSTIPSYERVKVKLKSINDIEPVKGALIERGFKVSTVVDTVSEVRNVFFWIQTVLASLGLIAIVVASIGMFNTLTISLLERTREIGIMKALGVKKGDIGRLFLAESILMGLLGGMLGVVLAFLFQQLTIFILSLLATLVQGTVPGLFLNQWYIVLGFILFALLIALLTGIYPARRAARINPIEAIRYE